MNAFGVLRFYKVRSELHTVSPSTVGHTLSVIAA